MTKNGFGVLKIENATTKSRLYNSCQTWKSNLGPLAPQSDVLPYIIIPPPQNVGGGLYWIRFVASVGRSVRLSVSNSCPLYNSFTNGRIFPSNLNDTFTSTRGCAEPMLLMCQLKVKVTVKGQIF